MADAHYRADIDGLRGIAVAAEAIVAELRHR
jgi:hypothetical protein